MEQFLSQLWATLAELATTVGLKAIYAILILIIGLKIVKVIIKKLRKKALSHIDESVGKFLISALSLVLNVVVLVTAAMIIGVPATSFVALLGSAGLAVGLALQGSLSNLAGSIMLLIFKPFKVGDYVEVSGVAGVVEEINLFYTVLNTVDNKHITVPNGAASNAVIIDYSTQNMRRVDLEFGVAYGTDVDKFKAVMMKVAESHALVLKDPAPVAYLLRHDDSALTFVLRSWCATGDYWTVYFDLIEQVHKAINAEGIEIPFPQVDVHMK